MPNKIIIDIISCYGTELCNKKNVFSIFLIFIFYYFKYFYYQNKLYTYIIICRMEKCSRYNLQRYCSQHHKFSI